MYSHARYPSLILLLFHYFLTLTTAGPVSQASPPNSTHYKLVCADDESGDPLCKDAKCNGEIITGGHRACQSLCYCKNIPDAEPINPYHGFIEDVPKPVCPPGPFLHPPVCANAICMNGAITGAKNRACVDVCSCDLDDVGFNSMPSRPRCPKGSHIQCGDAICHDEGVVGAMRHECIEECTCKPRGPPKLDCGHSMLPGRNGTHTVETRLKVQYWCRRKEVSAVCGLRKNVVVQGRDILGVCKARCKCVN